MEKETISKNGEILKNSTNKDVFSISEQKVKIKNETRVFVNVFQKASICSIIGIICSMMFFTSCASYRVATSFHLLNRGMTKQEFVNWAGLNNDKNYVGKQPVSSKSFRHGPDVWEVWVFEVYKFYESGGAFVDRCEHVAFKNGRLEEWGTGELPITIRQNPNQFQYDININR